jgi:hypothetical protein
MLNALENFYAKHNDAVNGCFIALKQIILSCHPNIETSFKYGGPFFSINNKMFCYLWYHKKYKMPYIGFIDGALLKQPYLLQEKRVKMKIMLINPNLDLPITELQLILQQAVNLKLNQKAK